MANNNAGASTFSFTPPQWLTSLNGTPRVPYAAVSKELLGFTASRLQDHADYLKRLADCADLAEIMKCHFEFAQQSWSRSVGEAGRVFEHLRSPSADS